jgi:hypothetical protein
MNYVNPNDLILHYILGWNSGPIKEEIVMFYKDVQVGHIRIYEQSHDIIVLQVLCPDGINPLILFEQIDNVPFESQVYWLNLVKSLIAVTKYCSRLAGVSNPSEKDNPTPNN